MADIKSMNIDQLRAYKSELASQGKTESNSKEAAKVYNLIKVMKEKANPGTYGDKEMASAYENLSSGVTKPGGWTEANAEDIYKYTGQYPNLDYGTSGGSGSGFSMPKSGSGAIDLSSIYDNYFNTPEIQAKKKEVSDVEASRDTAITSVQNNPWYSQATRGGKIAGVKSDAERNLGRINDELTRMQTDAQIKYNIKLQQYDINRQAFQDSLTVFNLLLNSGGLLNAKGSDISKLSVQTGIPTSMINSIIETTKTKNLRLEPYVDDAGQWIYAIDPTGKVVNKTFIGKGPSKAALTSYSNPTYDAYIPGASGEPLVPKNNITDMWGLG